jgi:hypothetical protein
MALNLYNTRLSFAIKVLHLNSEVGCGVKSQYGNETLLICSFLFTYQLV